MQSNVQCDRFKIFNVLQNILEIGSLRHRHLIALLSGVGKQQSAMKSYSMENRPIDLRIGRLQGLSREPSALF